MTDQQNLPGESEVMRTPASSKATGLELVNFLVKLHSGQVTVGSGFSDDSCFIFTLPLVFTAEMNPPEDVQIGHIH